MTDKMNENTSFAPVVASSPHMRHGVSSTRSIMLDVLIALALPGFASIFLFGWGTVGIMSVCVASCMATEYMFCLLRHRVKMPRDLQNIQTVGDLSAAVTGLLLAFNLPAGYPLWQAALGGIAAIAAVKMLFGGLGQNIVNPALAGRIILMISYPDTMNRYLMPFRDGGVDAVSSATPLAAVQSGENIYQYKDLFFGLHPGTLGEVCVAVLLIGGIYLVLRRVITPLVPACFIGTVFVLTWMLGQDPVYHILSGGLMLGAIFMATDYTTSPITWVGRVIFAVGCGILTVIIRLYGSLPEGVSFAIIIMNILTPLIDRYTLPRPFGKRKGETA